MTTCALPSDCMATSTTVVDQHEATVEEIPPEVPGRVPMNVCPPSSFPDKFQDFFAALTEDGDDLPSMLEDKLIPRYTYTRDNVRDIIPSSPFLV